MGQLGIDPSITLSNPLFRYLGFPTATTLTSAKNNASIPLLKIDNVRQPFKFREPMRGESKFALPTAFGWTSPKSIDTANDANTYIIESQSFTLDSYDSYGLTLQERRANSGGSRRNILATIPIGEKPTGTAGGGIIQYEPANLYYIAIKNRGEIVTRQLRFRLLNNQYERISTEGLTQMVILIKEP